MDFFRIECFLKVAEYGNMTKAAESMNITQPAISFQIRQMEKELELKVIDRDNRGIHLTEEGRFLANGLSQMHQSYRQLIHQVKQLSGKKKRLLIGFHGPVAWAGTSEFIADFSHKYPEIEVVIVQQHWKELAQYLSIGAIDAAFLAAEELEHRPELQHIPLFQEKACFAMSRKHPLAGRQSVTIEDIQNEKICMNNHASDSMDAIVERMYQSGIKKSNIIFSDSMEDTLAMAASDLGISSLPRSFKTASSALCYVDYEAKEIHMDYSLAIRADTDSEPAKLFMKEAGCVSWPYLREAPSEY